MHASRARMLVANLDDASNSNLTMAFRDLAESVPVVALVEERDAIDVLELSGADYVIPLKHQLGQQLAGRVPAGRAATIVVGRFHQLLLATFRGLPTVLDDLFDSLGRTFLGLALV